MTATEVNNSDGQSASNINASEAVENTDKGLRNFDNPKSYTDTQTQLNNTDTKTRKKVINDIEKRFRRLCRTYKKQKRIYSRAASYYANLHLYIFIIPLLLIQVAAAIIPSALNQESHEKTIHTISTTLAAVTAILIATDNKLAWEKISERFYVASTHYNSLATKAAYRCILDEDKKKELTAFLNECQRTEDTIKESLPLLPEWIEKRVVKSEKKRKDVRRTERGTKKQERKERREKRTKRREESKKQNEQVYVSTSSSSSSSDSSRMENI